MLLPPQLDAAPQSGPTQGSARQPTVNILDGMLAAGVKHHRKGRLPDAELIYRRILAIDSRHPPTLYMLGTLAQEVGRLEVATQLISAAIVKDPDEPAYHCRFGTILQAQGKSGQAAASYRRALQIDPEFAEAQANLEALQQLQGSAVEGKPFKPANRMTS